MSVVTTVILLLLLECNSGYSVRRRRRTCSPVNGGWETWSEFGTCKCNYDYGIGSKSRYRTCTLPSPYCGGWGCNGASSEVALCDSECCVTTPGAWSHWSAWSTCNCDNEPLGSAGTWDSTMRRERQCDNPAPSCGGGTCEGDRQETRGCSCCRKENGVCCVPTDGGWTEWRAEECYCHHGTGKGVRPRLRECNAPVAACGGKPCGGESVAHEKCDEECCVAQDGAWGQWGTWAQCNCTKQGGGELRRTRTCSPPMCYGESCVGEDAQLEDCSQNCSMALKMGVGCSNDSFSTGDRCVSVYWVVVPLAIALLVCVTVVVVVKVRTKTTQYVTSSDQDTVSRLPDSPPPNPEYMDMTEKPEPRGAEPSGAENEYFLGRYEEEPIYTAMSSDSDI